MEDTLKQVLVVTNALSEEEVLKLKDTLLNINNPLAQSKLNLVHVIPRLPTSYFNIPSMGALIEKNYEDAKLTLKNIGNQLNVSKNDQWLISGKLRTEVLRLANKLNANIILAGKEQLQELQRSLFFKNIQHLTTIKQLDQAIPT
jgi:hypothetical protein